MNWLDLGIVLFLLGAVVRGLEIGFVRQFFSTAGFFVGLFIGAWLEGKLIHFAHSPDSRAFLSLIVTLASALGVMGLGEYAGWLLKFKVSDSKWANKLDRGFGSVLGAVTLLAAVWLGVSIFRTMPDPTWQRMISSSRIVSLLDSHLPSAPAFLSRLGRLIDPNGFPQVFTGMEPAPRNPAVLPDMGQLNGVVAKDRASVVKIEGKGCGGIVEGSGFVVGSGEVVTNAHVVAGVRQPAILDDNGRHQAAVVLFDPNLDLAILRTSGLAGAPLVLNNQPASSGTAGAALGYPGGGDFSVSAAAVLDAFTANGRNIYNQGQTTRNIYSITADVEEGNSGGPLIATDGSVIGVVFAKSTTYQRVGYALAMSGVLQDISHAQHKTAPVSTGACTQ